MTIDTGRAPRAGRLNAIVGERADDLLDRHLRELANAKKKKKP